MRRYAGLPLRKLGVVRGNEERVNRKEKTEKRLLKMVKQNVKFWSIWFPLDDG